MMHPQTYWFALHSLAVKHLETLLVNDSLPRFQHMQLLACLPTAQQAIVCQTQLLRRVSRVSAATYAQSCCASSVRSRSCGR